MKDGFFVNSRLVLIKQIMLHSFDLSKISSNSFCTLTPSFFLLSSVVVANNKHRSFHWLLLSLGADLPNDSIEILRMEESLLVSSCKWLLSSSCVGMFESSEEESNGGAVNSVVVVLLLLLLDDVEVAFVASAEAVASSKKSSVGSACASSDHQGDSSVEVSSADGNGGGGVDSNA